jgi:hypothetical protein
MIISRASAQINFHVEIESKLFCQALSRHISGLFGKILVEFITRRVYNEIADID